MKKTSPGLSKVRSPGSSTLPRLMPLKCCPTPSLINVTPNSKEARNLVNFSHHPLST